MTSRTGPVSLFFRQAVAIVVFWWTGRSLFVTASSSSSSSSGAPGNYNYNAYNYDMAPTFTPDGRLLQVEYASAAPERSTPILALQVDATTLVLMALKDPTIPQNRILLVPGNYDGGSVSNNNNNGSNNNNNNNGSNVCIAMSGVLADSLSLVQVALQQAAHQYQQYQAPATASQLTKAMADACQQHAFGGGIRPYGCSLLVCGFSSDGGTPLLYQTDPSGAILEAAQSSSSSSSSSNDSMVRWMVGGNSALHRQLRKRLESSLSGRRRRGTKSSSLIDTLAIAAGSLIKETQKQTPTSDNVRLQNDGSSTSAATATATTSLEVVVMNSELGSHRLTREQVQAILERI